MSDEIVKRPVPASLVGKNIQPGQTRNPGGRKKGLERLVREAIGDDMPAIVRAQVSIAKGYKPDGVDGLPAIRAADMTKAAEWLADRGWGKARQTVDIGTELNVADLDATKLKADELGDMIAKLEAEVAAAEEEEAVAGAVEDAPREA